MITGVHHISLKCNSVKQFENTVDFYTRILGLKVLRQWGQNEDSGCMITAGNTIFEIFAKGKEIDGNGSINHVALACNNVLEDLARIKQAGYKVTVEPKEIDMHVFQNNFKIETIYPIKVAFFIGPVGESIELFEER